MCSFFQFNRVGETPFIFKTFWKSNFRVKHCYNDKVNKISIILIPIFKFYYIFKKIAHTLIHEMRCRKKFSGQNGDSIAGRKPFISRSNFTLWRCMMHRWKADTLSYMAVPITPIRPFTKCGSFWSHQSYLILQMFHFIFFQFVLTLSRTFTFLWNQTYPVHSTYIHLFVPSYSTGG